MSNSQNIYNQHIYRQGMIVQNTNIPVIYGQLGQKQLIYSSQNINYNTENEYNKSLKPNEKSKEFYRIISIPQHQQKIYKKNDFINLYQNISNQNIYHQTSPLNIYPKIENKIIILNKKL